MATWKLAKGKTWRQKLEQVQPNHGKVVKVSPAQRKRSGAATMVIPSPRDVDALMRQVPKGKVVTQSQIRQMLAKKAKADAACPMTTGIFLRIAAEAAEEDRRAGKKRITPYWRTIRDDGRLNDRFPGGAKAQASLLRREGIPIEGAGGARPPRVTDFESRLANLKIPR